MFGTLGTMKVKMILPALTEATSPFFRPIKYSLFPPIGLATLAAYLDAKDQVQIVDEHVEKLKLNDRAKQVAQMLPWLERLLAGFENGGKLEAPTRAATEANSI